MPKNCQIYNQQSLYIGPCSLTNYHFISDDGVLNNNYTDLIGNTNLLFPINRVFAAGYSITAPRIDVRSLGKAANVARPIINPPEITLNFDYYLMGLINEARLGFYVNHRSGNQFTGNPLYSNRVCPISGFIDRTYSTSEETEQHWPLSCRDRKNIFIGIKNDNLDFNDTSSSPAIKNNNIHVMAFGDCFLNSYQTSAAVNDIPKASVQYVVNNIEYHAGSSGLDIPSVNPKTYEIYSGIKFNLPNTYQGANLPSVLKPGDITVDIKNSTNTSPKNLSIDFNDIRIQNYNIGLDLNREPLYALGYKLPLDRRVKFPVFTNLSFNIIPGDNQSGSLVGLIKTDENYDITIKLRYGSNLLFTGVAIQYEFLKAKFNNISFNQTIGSRKTADLSFTSEIDPLDNTKGFFISGQLGIPQQTGDIIYLGGDFDSDSILDKILVSGNTNYLLLYNNSYTILY